MALQDGFNSILLSVTEKSIELKQSCRTMNESYSNYSNVKIEDLKLAIKKYNYICRSPGILHLCSDSI